MFTYIVRPSYQKWPTAGFSMLNDAWSYMRSEAFLAEGIFYVTCPTTARIAVVHIRDGAFTFDRLLDELNPK
jgi:hypothetical protein